MARAEEGIMQFEFKRVACLISAALSALFVVSLCPAAQAQIVVNSTGDEGPYPNKVYVCDVDPVTPGNQCTLRAAIETANGLAGAEEGCAKLHLAVLLLEPNRLGQLG